VHLKPHRIRERLLDEGPREVPSCRCGLQEVISKYRALHGIKEDVTGYLPA
jgi:hypothetical protein